MVITPLKTDEAYNLLEIMNTTMKQTKQSILFSFVLAVMMLVGANTAFGQLIATNTTGASTSFNTCAVANWNAAIAAAGDGGAISITDATTCVIPGGTTEATASVLVNKNVTITTALANAAITVGGTSGTAYLTVEAGKTLTVNKGVRIEVGGGTAGTNDGVLQVAATGTVALASNGTAAGTSTDASAIRVNAAGTLTNNGVITTLEPGGGSTTTTIVAVSTNSAVYYSAGAIGGTGAFGNIFFIGAFVPTATLSHTYRIASGREVRIAASITLPTTAGTSLSFTNAESAGTVSTLTVRHSAGTIVSGVNNKLTIDGNFVVATAVVDGTVGTNVWTANAATAAEATVLTVRGTATFTSAGNAATPTGYTFPANTKIIAGTLSIPAANGFLASAPIITVGTAGVLGSVSGNISIQNAVVDPTSVTMAGGTTASRTTYNFINGVAITTLTINGHSASLADNTLAGAVTIGTSGSLNVNHNINTAGTFTVGSKASASIAATKTVTAAVVNKGTLTNLGIISTTSFTNSNGGTLANSENGAATFTNAAGAILVFSAGGAFANTTIGDATYTNIATVTNRGYFDLDVAAVTFANNGGDVSNSFVTGVTNSGDFLLSSNLSNTQTYSTDFRRATAKITNNAIFTVGGAVTNNATIENNAIPTVVATTRVMSVTGAFTNSVSSVNLAGGYVMNRGTLTNNGVLDITGAVINKGTFTNDGLLTAPSFANEADETTVTNVGYVKTTPSAVNSGYFTVTGAVTNSGGTFTNSDTLSVGTSLTNSFKELPNLIVRERSTFDNVATGVVLAKRVQNVDVDLPTTTAKRRIINSGAFTNDGTVNADSLTLGSTLAATTGPLYAAVSSFFTNNGTATLNGFANDAGGVASTSEYTNNGTTAISAGVDNTGTAVNIQTKGSFSNVGTYTNTGTTTFPVSGKWANTGAITVSGGTFSRTGALTNAGTFTVSGGASSLGATTNGGSILVTAGTLTLTGTATNSASSKMTVSGSGNLIVVGALNNAGTLRRGTENGASAASGGTFTVRGTLTNTNTGTIFRVETGATAAVAAGDLTLILRAAQSTGYLEGVLTAAATDGIVVHGNFANSGTYTGNVIVSSDASGTTIAGTRAISGAGTFGGLTLSGNGIKTLSTNITVNQLFLRGGRLNAAAIEGEATTTAFTVTVAGAARLATEATQTFVNGLSANGVFVGTDARWSDLVTVTMGTADLFASLGQMTATLANGPLSVPSGTTQLVGNAFVKSALIAGKVNRLSCFTFTTDVAMSTTSAGNVVVPDVCEVEEVEVTAVQIINNVAGSTYDVTFNGESFATDLAYQTATEVDLFEAGDATFVFTQGTTSYTFEVTLEESNPFSNDNYILIIQGGADGKAVELVMVPYARFLSNNAATMQFIFNHGVTNGPAVTVERVSTSTPRTLEQLIAVNATYGSVTQYLTQTDPSFTTLRMKAGGAVVGQYLFDFTGYDAQAVTLLATGRVGGAGANALMIIAVDAAGDVMRPAVTTSDDNDSDVAAEIPAEFTLNGNFPNPFNPTTNISFDLPEQANVRIEIIDLLGRQVMAIAPQSMSAGANKIITVDAARLSSGVYFYRLIAEGSTKTFVQGSKFTLVK